MLTKEQKREQSNELRGAFADITTLFVLTNSGLSVNEVNELRSKVRESNATYRVAKNSVVRLAVEGTSLEDLGSHLQGPNGFAFTTGDGIALAKVLRDFVKTHPALTLRNAWLDGQVLGAEQAAKIADLPSREELIARLLYLLQSPIRRLAVALNGPIQKLASVVHQIADGKAS
jgi:large subunit ribosomal protein L10